MKLSLRLLLGFFVIVAVAAFFVFTTFVNEVKPGVRRATEDTLVDMANILAALASADYAAGQVANGWVAQSLAKINHRPIGAKIYGIEKNEVISRVYMTDANGIVLYDSSGVDTGRDYSRWNDVKRTLQGKYGARSTMLDPNDDNSTVMYVAAPVYNDNELVGVLTVAQPNDQLLPIMKDGERKILTAGSALLGIALVIGLVMVWWINRDINRLVSYAEAAGAGRALPLPRLGSPELSLLARSLEGMRLKLAGKEYVTHYVHALTHELKSPLAAIRGSAEILLEGPPPEAVGQFSASIHEQTLRIQRLIDKMLMQAKLEAQLTLDKETLDIQPLVDRVIDSKMTLATQHGIRFDVSVMPARIDGDALLLTQAIGNLIDNAIDFSPADSVIVIAGTLIDNGRYCLTVRDYGSGIPDYALDRVFERFYSLPRPTGAKSTGLGLSFVQEVAERHGGSIDLTNAGPGGGAEGRLVLPCRM